MLRSTEGGTRKPRLFIDAEDSIAEQGSNNPIAAALAAKTRTQEQALKAAAAAAAKAAAANVITYFADDPPSKAAQRQDTGASDHERKQEPRPLTNGLPEVQPPAVEASSLPADADAVLAEQAEAQDGINPLASLLGYSGDDGSGSEAGNDTPEREPSDEPRGGPLPASDDNDSSIDADAWAPGVLPSERMRRQSLPLQLASFMEELESSGLLKEGPSGAGDADPGAEDPVRQAGSVQEAPSTDAAPAQGAQDAAEGAADTAVADPAGSAPGQAGQADAEGAQEEAAEQRVLGALTGCPGWHEVMDMASGKVYFWNEESNEVAWDPPAGSEPRESGENEAVFAAAQAASVPQDSMQGEGSAPEPEPGRPASADQANGVGPARLGTPEAAQGVSVADAEDGEPPPQSSLPMQPVQIPLPDEAIGQAAEELLTRAWAAAEQLCGRAPLLVRLAVEAEVRVRDWRALAARQQQAAERRDAAASLSWEAYQQAARADWERLQGALPGALREAEAASAQAAAAVAAARQPPRASPEDGEVLQKEDGEAPPPLPADDEPPRAKAKAIDTAAAHDAVRIQTPLPHSTSPATTQAQPSSSSSSPIAASLASAEQKGTPPALPQPQPAAAADLVAAQINSRVAAAASAPPANASAAPSAAAAPVLAQPPPGAAPLWPGYYHPALPFPYPYQPYHYAPYPAAFLPPPWAAPRPAMPAAVPSSSAAGEDSMDVESPPPLPQDEQPPLPSSAPAAAAAADALPASDAPGPAQPAKQREYRAEPVRSATPPAAAEAPVEPPGASNPAEESKKRKAKKAPAASVKRRAVVKVGSLAPAVLNKWAAARKDLEDKEAADEGTDADAAERRRAREAEEWRLKQLRSGVSSQANSNFQPLAMDWREKIKAAKGKPSEAPQAVATKPQPVKYASKPDLEALSGGLPPGWKALWDKKSGEVFYGNPATKETSWDKPD